MPTNILMPKWGMSMKEGRVATWLKSTGDAVEEGEAIVEIESDKAVNLVESPVSGVLAQIVVDADQTVPISTVIAVVADPGEDISDHDVAAPGPDSVPVGEGQSDPSVKPTALATEKKKRVPASPAAKRLAKERGIDLATVQGTGPKGLIVIEDVEAAEKSVVVQPVTKVNFFSDGLKLSGVLYMPANVDSPAGVPTFVLCQGFTYTQNMLMPEIAHRLTRAGFAALSFDYRGFGESEGDRGRLQPLEQIADIRAAVSYLLDEPLVNASRLGLLGVSLGGGHAISAAALESQVASVVAIAPVTDGQRWLRGMRHEWQWRELLSAVEQDRRARARGQRSQPVDPWQLVLPDPQSKSFLDELLGEFPDIKSEVNLATAAALMEYSPQSMAAAVADRPMLIVHGESDLVVPLSESELFLESADLPASLVTIDAMTHFEWGAPGNPLLDEVMGRIVDWLTQ